MKIANPLNAVQVGFNELCDKGGGAGGGPARTKVQELLHQGSKKLNALAYDEISQHLKTFSSANPWHVCFAVGLGWGHLAKIDEDFTAAAIEVLGLDLVDRPFKEIECTLGQVPQGGVQLLLRHVLPDLKRNLPAIAIARVRPWQQHTQVAPRPLRANAPFAANAPCRILA